MGQLPTTEQISIAKEVIKAERENQDAAQKRQELEEVCKIPAMFAKAMLQAKIEIDGDLFESNAK